MPLYEYTCQHCKRRFTWLVGVIADPTPPTCDKCGATQAERKAVSRFALVRSEDDALDSLADPDAYGDLEDPRAMRKWAKEMGKEMGEDLGDDFDEYLDAAERGEEGELDDAEASYPM